MHVDNREAQLSRCRYKLNQTKKLTVRIFWNGKQTNIWKSMTVIKRTALSTYFLRRRARTIFCSFIEKCWPMQFLHAHHRHTFKCYEHITIWHSYGKLSWSTWAAVMTVACSNHASKRFSSRSRQGLHNNKTSNAAVWWLACGLDCCVKVQTPTRCFPRTPGDENFFLS